MTMERYDSRARASIVVALNASGIVVPDAHAYIMGGLDTEYTEDYPIAASDWAHQVRREAEDAWREGDSADDELIALARRGDLPGEPGWLKPETRGAPPVLDRW